MTPVPPSTLTALGTDSATLASALSSWGASGDVDALGAWGCGCPPAFSRVLGPLDAHNAPGPRGKHGVSTPRPRDTYLQGER